MGSVKMTQESGSRSINPRPKKPLRHPYRSVALDDLKNWNHYTLLHFLTLIPGFFIFLPFRLIFGALAFLLLWVVRGVCTIGIKKLPSNHRNIQLQPAVGKIRRSITHYLGTFAFRLLWFVFGVYWIHVDGKENIDKKARIITPAPHATMMDGIIMSVLNRPFSGIALLSERARPLTGKMFQLMDYIWVNYDDPASRKACVESMIHRTTSPDWSHIVTILFIEGGVNAGTQICQAKRGAFVPGQPIQPCLLEFPEWIDVIKCNVTKTRTETRGAGWLAWSHDSSMKWLGLYYLCVPWQPVIIKILPAYYPNEIEQEDALIFGKNVRKYMCDNSRFTAVDTNKRDGKLFEHGKKKGFSSSDMDDFYCFGAWLEDQYGIKLIDDKEIADLFDCFIVESEKTEFVTVDGKQFTFFDYVDSFYKKKSENPGQTNSKDVRTVLK